MFGTRRWCAPALAALVGVAGVGLGGIGVGMSTAQAATAIFLCAGKPAIFTSDARLAASMNCRAMDARGANQDLRPVTVVVSKRGDALSPVTVRNDDLPRESAAPLSAATGPRSSPTATSAVNSVVPRSLQSQRDKDRERILQDELAREREKLQTLTASLSKAQAEGSIAGGGAYIDHLRQSARRSASDVDAISREIARAGRN